MNKVLTIAALAALAGCGGGDEAGTSAAGNGAAANASLDAMTDYESSGNAAGGGNLTNEGVTVTTGTTSGAPGPSATDTGVTGSSAPPTGTTTGQ